MITPTIKAFHSPDVDVLENYCPTDEAFSLLVQMFIGPEDGEGEESFDVQVVTPLWLERHHAAQGLVAADNMLIVLSYDWSRIEAHLRERVAGCQGQDWDEVAGRISRFSQWEFEDYEK